jgi:hypothetical protein
MCAASYTVGPHMYQSTRRPSMGIKGVCEKRGWVRGAARGGARRGKRRVRLPQPTFERVSEFMTFSGYAVSKRPPSEDEAVGIVHRRRIVASADGAGAAAAAAMAVGSSGGGGGMSSSSSSSAGVGAMAAACFCARVFPSRAHLAHLRECSASALRQRKLQR